MQIKYKCRFTTTPSKANQFRKSYINIERKIYIVAEPIAQQRYIYVVMYIFRKLLLYQIYYIFICSNTLDIDIDLFYNINIYCHVFFISIIVEILFQKFNLYSKYCYIYHVLLIYVINSNPNNFVSFFSYLEIIVAILQ